MPWGRKSHFYCEVDSARQHTEKICSTRERGLHVTAAGWHGAIRVDLYGFNEDRFTVSFMPWLKSDSFGNGVIIANGSLDFDSFGPKFSALAGNTPMVRLDTDVLAALEFIRAKQIMLEGIDTTS